MNMSTPRRIAVVCSTATAALLIGANAHLAFADPITCPNGQVSEKVDGQFQCVNGGGNTSNADDPRNPNR